MSFEVVTPATDLRITTLESARLRSGDTLTDEQLTQIIDQATAVITAYLQLPAPTNGAATLAREEVVETFRPRRGMISRLSLRLSKRPVVSVESVEVDGVALDPSDYYVEDSMVWRTGCWPATSVVEVAYTGGYLMPDNASPTLPADLEAAGLDMVKVASQQIDRDPTIKVQRILDIEEIQYWVGKVGDNGAIDPASLSRLAPYRRFT